MGAQVIFAVNHAYLDDLTEDCIDWLSLQASVFRPTPATWQASSWDQVGRSFRRGTAPAQRAALSFSYSDYQAKSLYLVGHDLVTMVTDQYDLDLDQCSRFSDVGKQIAKQARYSKFPFSDRNVKHSFGKACPQPPTPGPGSITVFCYDTDFFSWGDTEDSRVKLDQIYRYCSTGLHDGCFGSIGKATGHFGGNFRPIVTLAPEQRALISLQNGREHILTFAQRNLEFTPEFLESGKGRLDIINSIMASEGFEPKHDRLTLGGQSRTRP